MKSYTLDPKSVANQITALVDKLGPGLSQERERQLERQIQNILDRHECKPATAKP